MIWFTEHFAIAFEIGRINLYFVFFFSKKLFILYFVVFSISSQLWANRSNTFVPSRKRLRWDCCILATNTRHQGRMCSLDFCIKRIINLTSLIRAHRLPTNSPVLSQVIIVWRCVILNCEKIFIHQNWNFSINQFHRHLTSQ